MTDLKTLTVRELIDSTLKTAFDYVRSSRACPELDDRELVRLGLYRVLSTHQSGREWLQACRDSGQEAVPRSTFFDAVRSPRRALMVADACEALAQVANRLMSQAGVDWLAHFPELKGCEILAADGHVIEHACHAATDRKGRRVPVGIVYAMDLRNGLSVPVAPISGDGRRQHEWPVLRDAVRGTEARPGRIFVLDRAYHDKQFWTRMVREKGFVMITRTKREMRPVHRIPMEVDRRDPINANVTGYYLVGLEGAYGSMFEVTYTNPEDGEEFSFLTTGEFPRPGIVAWLYFLRWKIEKMYDTFKNRFGETKAWANGPAAAVTQSCLLCMTYNLLRLLEALLRDQYDLRDAKVERKYALWLQRRAEAARKNDRALCPLLQMPRMPQLSAQFIRAVRNCLFVPKTIEALLAVFIAAFQSYL